MRVAEVDPAKQAIRFQKLYSDSSWTCRCKRLYLENQGNSAAESPNSLSGSLTTCLAVEKNEDSTQVSFGGDRLQDRGSHSFLCLDLTHLTAHWQKAWGPQLAREEVER